VRGLQSILDVCQAYAQSHEIIFSCSKTVCMMFKGNKHGHPVADTMCAKSKIC